MNLIAKGGGRCVSILRWTARIISSLVILYTLFMLIASALFDPTPADAGIGVFVGFAAPTMLALVLSWRWERLCGWIALIGSIGMGVTVFFTSGHNELLAGILIPSPFYVSAILFILSGMGGHSSDTS